MDFAEYYHKPLWDASINQSVFSILILFFIQLQEVLEQHTLEHIAYEMKLR